MELLDKIGGQLINTGKAVGETAKKMTEIAGLKIQIRTCEDVVNKNIGEIGRKYYEKYADAPAEEFARQCRAIGNAKKGIADLEKRIEEIKGSQ